MTHNCLFTINLNGFVTNYIRDHMLAACDRWGCDYVEIHDFLVPGYASCSKYSGPHRLQGYRKLLMLDGDILVSSHAPNPFDFCTEPNVFYTVADYLQAPNHCEAWINGPYTLGTKAILLENPELHPPPYETFFNSGFWLFYNTPQIRATFQRAMESLRQNPNEKKGTFYAEQGVLNVLVHNDSNLRISLLPETWNHMIPQDCEPIPEYYMNHFGGWAKNLLARKSAEYEIAKRTGVPV